MGFATRETTIRRTIDTIKVNVSASLELEKDRFKRIRIKISDVVINDMNSLPESNINFSYSLDIINDSIRAWLIGKNITNYVESISPSESSLAVTNDTDRPNWLAIIGGTIANSISVPIDHDFVWWTSTETALNTIKNEWKLLPRSSMQLGLSRIMTIDGRQYEYFSNVIFSKVIEISTDFGNPEHVIGDGSDDCFVIQSSWSGQITQIRDQSNRVVNEDEWPESIDNVSGGDITIRMYINRRLNIPQDPIIRRFLKNLTINVSKHLRNPKFMKINSNTLSVNTVYGVMGKSLADI